MAKNDTVKNWYKDFFCDLATEFWQQCVPDSFTEKEVEFIKESIFSSVDKDEFVLGSQQLYLIARKN